MDNNLVELQNKIKQKRLELLELEKEFESFPRLILMYSKTKGKHTFVFQPIKQVHNLESNGWVQVENFNKKVIELGLIN